MSTRLSPEVKRIRATSRPDRGHKSTAVDRLEQPPDPPDYLSERARPEWVWLARVCVELGVLTSADERSLALLSEGLAMEGEMRDQLRREGLMVPGAHGTTKAHPALHALESTRAQCMRLMTDFGLNPRARLGVDMRPMVPTSSFANNGRRPVLDRYLKP